MLTEEEALARATVDKVLLGQAHHFHDAGELLLLVLAGEDGIAGVHLCDDAAETPHLPNGWTVSEQREAKERNKNERRWPYGSSCPR